MNRYGILKFLGDGTYGTVMLGERVDTGEKVKMIVDTFSKSTMMICKFSNVFPGSNKKDETKVLQLG